MFSFRNWLEALPDPTITKLGTDIATAIGTSGVDPVQVAKKSGATAAQTMAQTGKVKDIGKVMAAVKGVENAGAEADAEANPNALKPPGNPMQMKKMKKK